MISILDLMGFLQFVDLFLKIFHGGFLRWNSSWWHDIQGYVDISITGYLQKILERLQHIPKVSPKYSQHIHIPIQYATKNTRKYANAPDTSPLLGPTTATKYIQPVICSLLYYSRAINHIIFTVLNEIASNQVQPYNKQWTKRNTSWIIYTHIQIHILYITPVTWYSI